MYFIGKGLVSRIDLATDDFPEPSGPTKAMLEKKRRLALPALPFSAWFEHSIFRAIEDIFIVQQAVLLFRVESDVCSTIQMDLESTFF